jgi:hypothetical protein
MDDDHLDDEIIDAYLAEALEDGARRATEVHLGTCTACLARVSRAAETELALLTVAAEPPPRRTAIVRRTVVGVAFAMAAAAGLAIVLRGPASDPAQPTPAAIEATGSIEPPQASDLVFADAEEQLQLPSSAELVVFVPEAEP